MIMLNVSANKEEANTMAVVAIGTSTGGPRALQEILPLIPADIPASFVIVQHMPAGFTKSLAERLNSLSDITVKGAEAGDILKPGWAYIAPGDRHMLFDKLENGKIKIRLSSEPPVNGHRPCVDVTMKSLSDTRLNNIIGIILTGMGKDGSEGIKVLKEKCNCYTIAQDEKSSTVYGMPRAAVQTGAVDTVLPLGKIADEIIKYLGGA